MMPTDKKELTNFSPGVARMERFHQLDGLRAVAIGLVVWHHSLTGVMASWLAAHHLNYLADLLRAITGSGVELFFVLSGVVLLRPYARRARRFDVRTYAERRFQRLYPPYWVAWLAAGVVIALVTIWPTWYSLEVLPQFNWKDWLGGIAIFPLSDTLYNGAWWSLSIEMTFYLLVPLIVAPLASTSLTRRLGWVIYALSIVISMLAAMVFPFGNPRSLFSVAGWTYLILGFGTYVTCFAGGILAARFDFAQRTSVTLMIFGLFYTLISNAVPFLNIHAGLGVFYLGLVTYTLGSQGRITQVLRSWPSVWIGERSYSLFLVHFTVFYLVNHLTAFVFEDRDMIYFVVSRLIGLPLAMLFAMVLFTTVERRFARGLATAGSFWPSSRKSVHLCKIRLGKSEAS